MTGPDTGTSGGDRSGSGPAVRRLNHAVLFVRDSGAAARFYCEHLGFSVVHEIAGRAAFLRARGSSNDHDLGLFAMGPGASARDPRAVGLYHLAWQVDTIDELADLRFAAVLFPVTLLRVAMQAMHAALAVIADAATGPLDLLVTDIVMPDMGGRALTAQLRDSLPHLRTLFMSGYTGEAAVLTAVQDAQVAFIQKPFTPSELARKVRAVLD